MQRGVIMHLSLCMGKLWCVVSVNNTRTSCLHNLMCYAIKKIFALSCGTASRHWHVAGGDSIWLWNCRQTGWLVSDRWHHLQWYPRRGPAVTMGRQPCFTALGAIISFVVTRSGSQMSLCLCPTDMASRWYHQPLNHCGRDEKGCRGTGTKAQATTLWWKIKRL